jgi:hypothetical protein
MCASSHRTVFAFILGVLLLASPVFAVSQAVVDDAPQVADRDNFQRTIEARCTICHTRQRVDAAISQQEELDALMQRMIERGAILNERDKSVLGTFWGSPLKGDKVDAAVESVER